ESLIINRIIFKGGHLPLLKSKMRTPGARHLSCDNAVATTKRPSGDQRGEPSPSDPGKVEIRRLRRSQISMSVCPGPRPVAEGTAPNKIDCPSGDQFGSISEEPRGTSGSGWPPSAERR